MAKHIFAPWRGDFIRSPKERGCVFCRIFKEHRDRANLILYRSEHCFVVFNRFPYTSGHLMVVPNRHVAHLEKLDPEVAVDLMKMTQLCLKNLKKEFSPRGFNLGMNLGQSAGAGIAGHLHLHIVPRWVGDSNFMASTGDIRVISISLEETYKTLHKYFQKL
jgi:ATP adenylyltransferase